MLSYILMKANLYYAGLLVSVLLVLVASGPSTSATITESTQSPQTTDQSDELDEGITTVAIGEGSNHTVSFRGDPSILPPLILPFAFPSGASDFELVPPFNQGEPVIIPAPDGREAIVALNNQTTYLNGTDIEVTLNSTLKWVNSGVIVSPMPSTDAAQPNSTETSTTGGEQIIVPPFPPVISFTVTFQEPGTYPYYCAIHPWMSDQVIVRGETETGTLGQNQTGTLGQNEVEASNPIFE